MSGPGHICLLPSFATWQKKRGLTHFSNSKRNEGAYTCGAKDVDATQWLRAQGHCAWNCKCLVVLLQTGDWVARAASHCSKSH